MNEPLHDVLEIEPPSVVRAAVIWLHGLGADKHDFEGIVPELGLPEDHAVRFVFPNAPIRPVTINAGQEMRAWYDILDLDIRAGEDGDNIRESEGILRGLIEREIARGIPASSIVAAGFSQGGAIALQAGLRSAEQLAGILALSTYLPLSSTLAAERSGASLDTPIFMSHGQFDPIIPMQGARFSRQLMESQGYKVEWHEYPMQHQICPEEINDVSLWLQRVLMPAEA
jgi:phospholipase/carboxylesterase